MHLLQRCGQDDCVEWVEFAGPDLPVVFCSPAHCRNWERSQHARTATEAHRCQWCWTRLGGAYSHEDGCPVRVEAP